MADGLAELHGGERNPRRARLDYADLDLRLDRLARSSEPRDRAAYRELMDGEALPPRLLVNAVETTEDLMEG